jgi:Spondin_N
MRLLCCLGVVLLFAACTKEKMEETAYSEAVYKVTFTGKWIAPQFPVPADAHFTPMVGMVHNSTAFMFRPGLIASPGVESVAENGNPFPLLAEADSLTALKKVTAVPIMFFPRINNSSFITIYCNSNFPLFSCMSMIAPTPDWFFGLHDFNLLQPGGWVTDTTVNVYSYDAGTEQGDVFSQDNAATVPQQPIALLTPANAMVLANGSTSIAPIGSMRFVRQ